MSQRLNVSQSEVDERRNDLALRSADPVPRQVARIRCECVVIGWHYRRSQHRSGPKTFDAPATEIVRTMRKESL